MLIKLVYLEESDGFSLTIKVRGLCAVRNGVNAPSMGMWLRAVMKMIGALISATVFIWLADAMLTRGKYSFGASSMLHHIKISVIR